MKYRKAKIVKFHDAVQMGGHVKTGVHKLNEDKHLRSDIEVYPTHVEFNYGGFLMFIYAGNVSYIELMPEELAVK